MERLFTPAPAQFRPYKTCAKDENPVANIGQLFPVGARDEDGAVVSRELVEQVENVPVSCDVDRLRWFVKEENTLPCRKPFCDQHFLAVSATERFEQGVHGWRYDPVPGNGFSGSRPRAWVARPRDLGLREA